MCVVAGYALEVARPLSFDSLLGGQRVREPVDTLAVDPAAAAEEFEVARRVRRAVEQLPPGQRSAVVLFYLGGLTHAETAAALGVSWSGQDAPAQSEG